MSGDLRSRLEDIVRATPSLMHVMTVARELDLPEWLIFSGAIYQPVLTHLTGREADYGIKDYDLGYFDPSDTSYEAEDEVIQRVAQTFAPPFSEMVEVRNQARVHLWFEDKFREPYAPLASSEEALSRFTTTAFSVGVRLEADDGLTILAPFGLEDLFALRLRPNPNRRTTGFGRTAESAMRRWPELRVIAG